jgi:PAS domain S-box-containing protein
LDRIFGVQADEFEPTYEGYLGRVHPEDREITKSVIDAAFRDGKPFDMEERILRPDGAVRVLHSQGQWTFDNSQRPIKLVGICQDITERKLVEQQLQTLSARLMRAQEEERARLARELHDDLSQEVAALSIATSNLKKSIPAGDCATLEQSDRIQQNLIRLADKVRRLSHNLHPAMLEFSGLGVAVQRYCAEFSQLTGVQVIFDAKGSFASVPSPVALSVYRVAQEALQNVLKHARVEEAHLGLYIDDQTLRLTVSDKGTGIDPLGPAAPGLGIVSIKERARMMGGTLTIESGPNRGTTLNLTVPTSAVSAIR